MLLKRLPLEGKLSSNCETDEVFKAIKIKFDSTVASTPTPHPQGGGIWVNKKPLGFSRGFLLCYIFLIYSNTASISSWFIPVILI